MLDDFGFRNGSRELPTGRLLLLRSMFELDILVIIQNELDTVKKGEFCGLCIT